MLTNKQPPRNKQLTKKIISMKEKQASKSLKVGVSQLVQFHGDHGQKWKYGGKNSKCEKLNFKPNS